MRTKIKINDFIEKIMQIPMGSTFNTICKVIKVEDWVVTSLHLNNLEEEIAQSNLNNMIKQYQDGGFRLLILL